MANEHLIMPIPFAVDPHYPRHHLGNRTYTLDVMPPSPCKHFPRFKVYRDADQAWSCCASQVAFLAVALWQPVEDLLNSSFSTAWFERIVPRTRASCNVVPFLQKVTWCCRSVRKVGCVSVDLRYSTEWHKISETAFDGKDEPLQLEAHPCEFLHASNIAVNLSIKQGQLLKSWYPLQLAGMAFGRHIKIRYRQAYQRVSLGCQKI